MLVRPGVVVCDVATVDESVTNVVDSLSKSVAKECVVTKEVESTMIERFESISQLYFWVLFLANNFFPQSFHKKSIFTHELSCFVSVLFSKAKSKLDSHFSKNISIYFTFFSLIFIRCFFILKWKREKKNLSINFKRIVCLFFLLPIWLTDRLTVK